MSVTIAHDHEQRLSCLQGCTHLVLEATGFCDGLPRNIPATVTHLTIDTMRLWDVDVDRIPAGLRCLNMAECANTSLTFLDDLVMRCRQLYEIHLCTSQCLGQGEEDDESCYVDLALPPCASLRIVVLDHDVYNEDVFETEKLNWFFWHYTINRSDKMGGHMRYSVACRINESPRPQTMCPVCKKTAVYNQNRMYHCQYWHRWYYEGGTMKLIDR